jgi:hypothetical protein
VDTGFRHNDMRDTGPDEAKTSIQSMLDRFLDKTDSDVAPIDTRNAPAKILDPGPVTLYVPDKKSTEVQKTEKDPSAATN